MVSLHVPDGNSARKEENEKRPHRGKPVFPGTGLFLYFPGPLLYFELYIEINVRNRVTQGQLLRPLSAYLCSYKGLTFVHNIFWSGDELTFYDPTFLSIDKG